MLYWCLMGQIIGFQFNGPDNCFLHPAFNFNEKDENVFNILFFVLRIFIWNELLIFVSDFYFQKHKKYWIYFTGMNYFQFGIFISKINFQNFKIVLSAGSKNIGCRNICPGPNLFLKFSTCVEKKNQGAVG